MWITSMGNHGAGVGLGVGVVDILERMRSSCTSYGRVVFTVFKHTDIKGVRQRLTSTASLDDGYCEATIPVVKGHHVT